MVAETIVGCKHQHYLNNDVHKLTLQSGTTEAVDAAIAHMKAILDEHDTTTPLLLLIDARTSVPSIPYFLGEVRKMYNARQELPPVRAAYIYEDSVLLTIIQAALNAIPMKANRRFIKGGKEVDALEWLLNSG